MVLGYVYMSKTPLKKTIKMRQYQAQLIIKHQLHTMQNMKNSEHFPKNVSNILSRASTFHFFVVVLFLSALGNIQNFS